MKQPARVFGQAALSAVMLTSGGPVLAYQSPPPQEPQPAERRDVTLGPSQPARGTSQPGQTQAKPELVLQAASPEPQVRLVFSPDGRLLASTGVGGHTLKLWEVASGRLLRQIELGSIGYDAGSLARPLVFSPDGMSIVTAAAGAVRRWDVATGRELPRVALASAPTTYAAAFGNGGRVLAESAMGDTDSVRCWDAENGRLLGAVEFTDARASVESETLAVSSNGERVAAVGVGMNGSLKDFQQTRVIAVWSAAGGPVQLFQEPGAPQGTWMRSVGHPAGTAFSPDGARVAARTDDVVTIWNAADGRTLASYRLGQPPLLPLDSPFYSAIGRVVFSPDGRFLAVQGSDGSSRLVDTSTGAEVRTLAGHAGPVVATAFSADSREAATAGMDGVIKLWDVSSGSELRSLRGASASPRDVAFSPDGRSLVVARADAACVWDTGTGDFRRSVALPDDFVRTWSATETVRGRFLSPDGRYFAAGSSRGPFVKIWDVTTGAEAQSIALAPGKELALTSFAADGRSLALFDRNDARAREGSVLPRPANAGPSDAQRILDEARKDPKKANSKEFKKLIERMSKAAESNDPGEMLKTMDELGLVPEGVRPVDPGFGLGVLDVPAGVRPKDLSLPVGPALPFLQSFDPSQVGAAMALSPDGRYLAITPRFTAPLSVIDVASATQAYAIVPQAGSLFYSVTWSPDGNRLATSELLRRGSGIAGLEFQIRLWDAQTGAEAAAFAGSERGATSLAISPDGRVLASAGLDGAVGMWDVATGRELRRLDGHSGGVGTIAFSPDGKFLVTGGYEGSARLWDVATGELLATLVCLTGSADWLVVTPDGLFDGSPGGWQQILWRFSNDTFDVAPVESFFFEYYHPGLLGEILAGKRPHAAVDIARKDRHTPKVEIALGDGAETGRANSRTARVRVSISDAAAGAQDVRLFRNGSLVKVWRGDVLAGQPSVSLETDVTVIAGENKLTAYAFNGDNVKSVDANLTLNGASSLRRPGTLHIVSIGVNAYANPAYDLRFAVPDARDIADEIDRQQKKIGAFGRIEIVRLEDADATKANILSALGRLAGASEPAASSALASLTPAEPEDAVVLYFAGHGAAQGDRYYLIPHDIGYDGRRDAVDAQGVRSIVSHAVSDEDLQAALERVVAGNILLVIDACNSGQALESEEKRRGPMNSRGLAQLAYEKGMLVLTASQSYQEALEARDLGHGLLTYALVDEGLKTAAADGAPKDGRVVDREWLDFAVRRVPELQAASERRSRDLVLAGEPARQQRATRDLQRPRVFYRREVAASPLVVARP